MYRTDNATSVASRPTPGAAGPNPGSFFTAGVPGSVPATIVDADLMNAVQEEIAETIEGAGITLDKTKVNQLLLAVQALAGAAGAHGQCQLRLSGSNLKLSQSAGNRLIVNGLQQQVPQGGVFVTPTGLTPATTYFIYAANFATSVTGAANNGSGLVRLAVTSTTGLVTNNTATIVGVLGTTEANGTFPITVIDATHIDLQGSTFAHTYVSGGAVSGLILEASTTGHSTASNGVETKSGDVTRTLVGMALCVTGPAWSTVVTQVLSWFSRRGITAAVPFTSNATTTSTSFVELSTSFRNTFLTWADEEVFTDVDGTVSITGATNPFAANTSIAYDGTTADETFSAGGASTTSASAPVACMSRKTLAEGLHFATTLGAVSTGDTASWPGNATPGQRTSIKVSVRG